MAISAVYCIRIDGKKPKPGNTQVLFWSIKTFQSIDRYVAGPETKKLQSLEFQWLILTTSKQQNLPNTKSIYHSRTFVTMTTTKFFSLILYSLRAVSSLRILPERKHKSLSHSDRLHVTLTQRKTCRNSTIDDITFSSFNRGQVSR